ncbi:MAG TPA: hypothetical protein PJ994_12035, partial [Tepidiformaceae bacterium]|nr:hypothetical protein [Tepidiformaceae bacterium]
REPHLRWAIRHTTLVRDMSSRFEQVTVLYDGAAVENLASARVAIWNDGHGAIRTDDFASTAPLVITSQGEILSAKLILTNDEHSQATVEMPHSPARSVAISLEYLEHRKGMVVQVLHTGATPESIRVEGKLIGSAIRRKAEDSALLPPWLYLTSAFLSSPALGLVAYHYDDLTQLKDGILAGLGGILLGPLVTFVIDALVREVRPIIPFQLGDAMLDEPNSGRWARWVRRRAHGKV